MIYALNVTSQSIDIQVVDDSGLAVTGLAAATFPTVKYSRAGANADVTIVLTDLALITTAWTSGGLKERGEGVYRLDLPDQVFTAAGSVRVRGEATGKHLIASQIDVGVTITTLTNLPAITANWLTTAGIADGAITEAKITTPTEAAGRPTGILAMMRRIWEWHANKRTRDRSTGVVNLRNHTDSATLETNTQATASTTDSISEGA